MPGGQLTRRGRRRPGRAASSSATSRSTARARRSPAPAPRSGSSACSPAGGADAGAAARSSAPTRRAAAIREVYWRDLGGFHADRRSSHGDALGAGCDVRGPGDHGAPATPRSSCRPGPPRPRRPARQHRRSTSASRRPAHGARHRGDRVLDAEANDGRRATPAGTARSTPTSRRRAADPRVAAAPRRGRRRGRPGHARGAAPRALERQHRARQHDHADLRVADLRLRARLQPGRSSTRRGDFVFFGPFLQYLAAATGASVKWTLENRSENPGIHDGDMFLSNDPWIGATHQSRRRRDRAPVFVDGKLFCWVGQHAAPVGPRRHRAGRLQPDGPGRLLGVAVHPAGQDRRGRRASAATSRSYYTRMLALPKLVALDLRAEITGCQRRARPHPRADRALRRRRP